MTSLLRATMGFGVAFCLLALTSSVAAGQNRDQQVANEMQRASLEVVRTAPTDADRFDTQHLVLYIDKGLLSPEAAGRFAVAVERGFVAVSEYIRRTYTPTPSAPKPSYYLTNRAGISHASATRVFLFARRVVPSPAISIHETVHLLLIRNPSAARNRDDLSPEEDARLMADSGVWLAEGFASYVADELASKVQMEPAHLFFNGDNTTIDDEARRWLSDSRGGKVAPFVGAHGVPDDFLADRANVAAPFYLLGQSFVKYVVQHAGIAAAVQLYEEHFDGTRSIEEDVKHVTGRDLPEWRRDWLTAISLPAR